MSSKEMFKNLIENKQNLNEEFIKKYINEYINKFNLNKYLDDVIVDNSFMLYCGYCENYDGKQVIFVDPSYVISDIQRNRLFEFMKEADGDIELCQIYANIELLAYITHELVHVRQRAIMDYSNSKIAKELKISEQAMLNDPNYYVSNEVHDSYMMEYNANFDGFYETYMYLDFLDSKYKKMLLKDFIKIAITNNETLEEGYNIHYGI
ncbi:MAG: hypothetical protein II309_02365 [Bacilli bacterium]|nr:hypothetical protein [Bacilli bacterium]